MAPLQLMRWYVQAHANIKMITISPALPEDVKKHMIQFLWQVQAEHTSKPPSILHDSMLIFHSCQLKRLPDFEFLAGHRETCASLM